MWILQLADLHNSNNYNSDRVEKIIKEMIAIINNKVMKNEELVFIICGDILNKGINDGYSASLYLIQNICKEINVESVKFLVCPGNHDIVNSDLGSPFKQLDKFIFNLTMDTKISFDGKNTNMITINNIDFIMINSSYHLNHEYGKIDLDSLNFILNSSHNKKVIILHHHLIPIREGENSTVVNSYEFFKILELNNVLAILHGHQHMKMQMVIGESLTKIIGVGSIFAEIATNYNNQFNLFKISGGEIQDIWEFKYNADEMGEGSIGRFIGKRIYKGEENEYDN